LSHEIAHGADGVLDRHGRIDTMALSAGSFAVIASEPASVIDLKAQTPPFAR
jgi:hypothetical protein